MMKIMIKNDKGLLYQGKRSWTKDRNKALSFNNYTIATQKMLSDFYFFRECKAQFLNT
jgi:hypothetical protein